MRLGSEGQPWGSGEVRLGMRLAWRVWRGPRPLVGGVGGLFLWAFRGGSVVVAVEARVVEGGSRYQMSAIRIEMVGDLAVGTREVGPKCYHLAVRACFGALP